MEYVEGVPINRFCDEKKLSIEKRIRLFIQVCEAVQYAHRNAVIHRDLKPSNILCKLQDGIPAPTIIDFGIAKALDGSAPQLTRLTRSNQPLGTPEYMSPEQTRTDNGQIDTRTDVYSLGVVLYELLTDTLPIDSASMRSRDHAEVHEVIRTTEARPPSRRVPSARSKQLRGDLDWITLKALEKDRDRRYDSPVELANDLLRHLDGKPVLAGPPRLSYKFAKWLIRHRTASILVSIAFLAVLSVAILSFSQQRRVEREQARTQIEAESAAALAGLVESMIDTSPDLYFRGRARSTPEQLFTRGIDQLDTLTLEPSLHARLTQAFGSLQTALGNSESAIPLLQDAAEQYLETFGTDHIATLDAQQALGIALGANDESGQALELLGQVGEALARNVGSSDQRYINNRVEVGLINKRLRRWDQAEAAFTDAVSGAEDNSTISPDRRLVYRSLLASIHLEKRQYKTVRRELLPIVDELKRVVGENHQEYRAVLYNLAAVTANIGEPSEAARMLAAIPYGPPTEPGLDPHFQPLQRLGLLENEVRLLDPHARQQLYREFYRAWFLEAYEESAQIGQRLFNANRVNLGLQHHETLDIMVELAWNYVVLQRPEEARKIIAFGRDNLVKRRDSSWVRKSTFLWIEAHCDLASNDHDRALVALEAFWQEIQSESAFPELDPLANRIAAERYALLGDVENAIKFARLTLSEPWYPYRRNLAFKGISNDDRVVAFFKEERAALYGNSQAK
jgi:tetratricopeptide (TPR) repeat protein